MTSRRPIHISDEELLIHLQKGDQEAFTLLYYRYHRKVYGYLYRMLNRDEALAGDLLQEVFVRVMEQAHRCDPERSFKTWLFTLAANLCKNQYRKWQNRDKAYENWADTQATTTGDLSLKMDLEQFGEALEVALESLEVNRKTAFILRYKEHFPLTEIAEIQQCPVGTVKSRLYYTIRQLQEKLAAFNPKTHS